MPLC
ncbi:hypothetical protein YPPY19_1830, partial [Yersinia pestis PY-19]|jgi:hypothetical protein